VWGSAQTARMDVGFTAFIALGAWQMQRGALMRSAVALGVATLIKGPMGIVIGVVLFILSRLSRPSASLRAGAGGDGSSAAPRSRRLVALSAIVMLAIPLAWFVPAVVLGGRAYAHDVVVKQTVGRAF